MGDCENSNQNAHNIDVTCEWPPGQLDRVPAAAPPAGDNDDALVPPADAAQEEPLLATRQGQVRAHSRLVMQISSIFHHTHTEIG